MILIHMYITVRSFFKMNINYCAETHTSFDSFYKLTVVYKWQLDSSVTSQACVNIIENFLRTESQKGFVSDHI